MHADGRDVIESASAGAAEHNMNEKSIRRRARRSHAPSACACSQRKGRGPTMYEHVQEQKRDRTEEKGPYATFVGKT